MSSKADLANLALTQVGITKFIGNLETDRTLEARVCRRWFEPSKQTLLRSRDWNVARRRTALAETGGTAPTNWEFEYTYPNSCLAIRGLILPGLSWPRKDQKIPFEIANSGTAKVIYTDLENAEAVWTSDIGTELFDALMEDAFVYLLASRIAIPLSVKPDMAKQARDAYAFMFSVSGAADAREGETGPEPENAYFAARNG